MIFGLPYYQSIKQFLKGERLIYLFMLLALALRVHNFSSTSIWYDESVTLKLAHQSWLDIYRSSTQDVNAPLYPFFIKLWTLLFGYSLSTVRFFSVVCSVLTVALIFKIADKNFGRKAAIFCSLFISISNIHIYYSEEGRCYATLCLFASVNLYYFFELLKLPSTRNIILYTGFGLFAIYTQFFFGLQMFVGFVILIYKNLNDLRVIKKLIAFHLLAALFFGVWFIHTFFLKKAVDISNSWIPPLSYENMLWYFRDLFNSENLAFLFVGLFFAFFIFLFFIKQIHIPIKQHLIYLFLLCFIPFLTMSLVSLFSTSVFYPRFLMFTSIPMILFLGSIVTVFKMDRIISGVYIICIVISIPYINVFAFRNQDWNIACRYEWAFRNDSTSTIVSPTYSDMCYIYYNMDWAYFEQYNNLWYFKEERKFMGCDDSLLYMKSKFSKSKRVVFFDASPDYDDRIISFLRNNYDSVFAKKLYGINFYVYDKKVKPVKDSLN